MDNTVVDIGIVCCAYIIYRSAGLERRRAADDMLFSQSLHTLIGIK